MRLFPALFLLLAALGGNTLDAQSPWARSKAGAYAQVAFQSIALHDAIFNEKGNSMVLEQAISEFTMQLYGEYGLSKRMTGILSIPIRTVFKEANLQYPTFPKNDFGDLIAKVGNISIAFRRQLLDKKLPLTLTMRIDLPSWASNPAAGLRAGYHAVTLLPMLSTGRGYEKAYWFGYGGYALRTNQYSDFALLGFEIGRKISRFQIIGYSELLLSIQNRTRNESETYQRTGLYVNNQSYWSIGLKGIIRMNRFWGFTLGGVGVLEARLLPNKPQFHIGAYFNWE